MLNLEVCMGDVSLWQDLYGRARGAIEGVLEEGEEMARRVVSGTGRWGEDAVERLFGFVRRGKLVRGALVWAGARVCGGAPEEWCARVGAALELFQSGLLVHDDVMDRDRVRRGGPSMFAQYEGRADEEGVREARRVGEALAVCVGDVAFFLGFGLLAGVGRGAAMRDALLRCVAEEYARVGVAQMDDVWYGATGGGVSLDDVLRVYRYKTGRYTFSVPLSLGALLAGADEGVRGALEEVGELLGVVFQIRDDELGLFGSEEEIGKPAGSDVREGKRTVFWVLLRERLEGEERRRLDGVWGGEVGEEELGWVRRMVEERGVREEVGRLVEGYVRRVEERMAGLGVGEEGRRLLEELAVFNLTRRA